MDTLFERSHAKNLLNLLLRGNAGMFMENGVYNGNKPNKLRVVFDCSAECKGASLNNELMSGPDLTNQIVGVLMRFRQEPIATIVDIESMFFQVGVPKEHQDFLRFLWWENHNLKGEPVDHQMSVHVFGGTFSPSCCNHALKRTSIENEIEFGEEAVKSLRRNFYVDDMPKSEKNEDMAIKLAKDVIGMCERGGFKLTKFINNSRKVLAIIPEERQHQKIENQDLDMGDLAVERALGVHWNVENGYLDFKIQLKD